jgi:hypothetical protein
MGVLVSDLSAPTHVGDSFRIGADQSNRVEFLAHQRIGDQNPLFFSASAEHDAHCRVGIAKHVRQAGGKLIFQFAIADH